jgi:outer membrane protein assembly factor BamA
MFSHRSLLILATLVGSCPIPRGAAAAAPDTLPPHPTSFVALPYAYYTPETKIAFGGGGIFSFRPVHAAASTRPSSVGIAVTYTQRNQILLALKPELYLGNERYYVSAFYGYYRYPDKFWGVGSDTPDRAEETYRSNDLETGTSVFKSVARGLYVGVRYEYLYLSVTGASRGGELATDGISGSLGGPVSGLGAAVIHDTRNSIYEPSSGFYNQCRAVFFGSAIGSEYAFTAVVVDLRMYREAFGSHVVALQMYDSFIVGDAPFQLLSLLGGSYRMRGFYLGRYRDRDMLTAQIEYRVPVWRRFGAVGFAGAGDVAHDVRGFRIDRLKTSVGFGARFMFDTRERINARLDVGFGSGDNAGVYGMVLEAF